MASFFDLTANADNVTFVAGQTADKLVRGLGGNDTLTGSSSAEDINGNIGNDSILGGGGDDTLRGGKGDDVLIGGVGDDYLFGNTGSNIVTGGDGVDVYVLARGGTIEITDYNDTDDFIGLPVGLARSEITVAQGTGTQSANTLITLNSTGAVLGIVRNTDASLLSGTLTVLSDISAFLL